MMNLPSNARVWVYQSDRKLTSSEKVFIKDASLQFVKEWAAHGASLQSDATIVGDYFLILAVNEQIANASGCSIDSSVKFVKSIGKELKIDFFNRLKLVVSKGDETKQIAFSELVDYKDWCVYNTLVDSILELNNSFSQNVTESDYYKMLTD